MQGFTHVMLLSGPSGSGKTTFTHLMRAGTLPEEIKCRLVANGEWPVIDVTNRMRREIASHGEAVVADQIAAPAHLVLHYDITTVYRYGLAGYANDPALRLLGLARNIQIVFVCPDAERLFTQYTSRDAARQARKHAVSRMWNSMVLTPMRVVHTHVTGKARCRERDLYRDHNWVQDCYDMWETYIGGLMGGGVAQDLIHISPTSNDRAIEPAFRIVPGPFAKAVGNGSRC